MAVTKISCNLTEDEFRKLQALLGRSRMARLLGVTIARIQQFKRRYKMTDPTKFKGKFQPAFNVPKEQLAEMYLGEKMSVHEIGKALGWSDWTIIKALRKEGIYKGRGGHLKEDIPVPVEDVQTPIVEVVEKPAEPEKPAEVPSEPMPEIPDEEYDVPVEEPVKEITVFEAPTDEKLKAIAKAVDKELKEKGIYEQMDKLFDDETKPPSQEKPDKVPDNSGAGGKPSPPPASGPETTVAKEADPDKSVKESIERIKNLQKTVEENKKKIQEVKNLRKKKDGVKVAKVEDAPSTKPEGDKDGDKSNAGEPQPK